jgi:protein-L-isoaspartate(D-aspartate) O-methyltransferase
MNFERARFNMIEQQIRPWQVLDQGVLSLLAVVKREDFVPAAWREMAFADLEVPLVEGGTLGRVMLSPKVEARLLQELALEGPENVLEVGTGAGHMAALLSHRARQVHTLEIDADLAHRARVNLRHAGIDNVHVVHADGSTGHAVEGPFDAIVLSGSVAQVPTALLNQLKPGGRLVAIVGVEPVMRAVMHTRVAGDHWRETVLFDTVAPRLIGFPEPSRFVF